MSRKSNKLGYFSGVLMLIFFLGIGFLIKEYTILAAWFEFVWPHNLIIYAVVFGLPFFYGLFVKNRFTSWLSSHFMIWPVAFVLLIYAGLYFYYPKGYYYPPVKMYVLIFDGFPVFFLSLFFTLCSGFTVANLIWDKNAYASSVSLFVLTLIVFVISTIGFKNDYLILDVRINKEVPVYKGVNYDGRLYQIPFAIKLLDVKMQEGHPALVINEPDELISDTLPNSIEIKQNETLISGDVEIEIRNYLSNAILTDSGFVYNDTLGAVHAAYINVTSNGRNLGSRWISTSSSKMEGRAYMIDDFKAVSMLVPRADSLNAHLRMFTKASSYEEIIVHDTMAYNFNGWYLKNMGYNPFYGQYTPTLNLVIEHDPWFYFKYVSLALVVLSLVLVISNRKKARQ